MPKYTIYAEVLLTHVRNGIHEMSNRLPSLSKDVFVKNEFGLHARPAAMIAEIAKSAKSRVWITKGEETVDASSVIDMLSIGCATGSTVTVRVEDQSDLNILDAIAELVEKGFGE